MLETFAAAVQDSQLATIMGSWAWAYPVANLLHILGVILLVGGIGVVDLRLVGMFRSVPLEPLMRALTPFAVAGFVLLIVTGPLLFMGDPTTLVHSRALLWKLSLIPIGGLNMIAFHWVRRGNTGDPTVLERTFAVISICLWLTVAALGRLIAFLPS